MYSTSFSSCLRKGTAIKERKKLRNAFLIYGLAKCLPPTWKSRRAECLSTNENQIFAILAWTCISSHLYPQLSDSYGEDIKSLGIWYCMVLFPEGEWMLLVTPFHRQVRYVRFQKQTRNAFKILSLQTTACASAIIREKGDCSHGQIPPLHNSVWGFCSCLCCRLLSNYDQTIQCLWVIQQCYHWFLACFAFMFIKGKVWFLLLLVDELVNQVGRQRVQGDVHESNFKNCKPWLTEAHLGVCTAISKCQEGSLTEEALAFSWGYRSEVPVC